MSRFDAALAVADAVLYEGYLLYPYTASARKNRLRWQFGVLVPPAYARAGNGESDEQQTEVLFEAPAGAEIAALLRFLHVETRRVEEMREGAFVPVDALDVDGVRHLTFEEGIAQDVRASLRIGEGAERIGLAFPPRTQLEELRDAAGALRGRVVRERRPLRGALTLVCEPALDGRYAKLRVRVENASEEEPATREEALRSALVATHVLLALEGGRFLSAADAPAALDNRHAWPVLIDDASLVLASPIILDDFPRIAPQTQADAFDATEIDELLTLSVLSLPQAERDEARATDPRARAIVERAERFGADEVARLHAGALDAGAGAGAVVVGGTTIVRGSRVRLHPKGSADVWDMFLADRVATVRAVHQDFEDRLYVAVTVDDDPASALHEWYGRSFFFSPEEVEPL